MSWLGFNLFQQALDSGRLLSRDFRIVIVAEHSECQFDLERDSCDSGVMELYGDISI
jgi:hypothetical protein